ncbi:MAG: FkbM family methyltransferase [Parvibaculum sp.]|uniref:FkbM family methyltransferase n=1 Tax=Parvibaculum sp. TaxID=2024848 RepID=UPI003C725B56
MSTSFKKKLAWLLGYDLNRINKSGSSIALTFSLLGASRANRILDVGANNGQFASDVLTRDAKRHIVSFEPLSEPFRILNDTCGKYPNWRAAPRMAIGEENGTVAVNISGYSGSSSILPILRAHTDAFPDSAYVSVEDVPIQRLDEAAKPFIQDDDRLYVKIDTQGFERQVFRGMTGILDRVVALQVELSLVQLYEGEALANEMTTEILAQGFKLFGYCNGFRDPATKALLQADGFFIRPN